MSRPDETYQREYEYALAHPGVPECKRLLEVAQLYARHPDEPTLGIMQGVIHDLRQARALLDEKEAPA